MRLAPGFRLLLLLSILCLGLPACEGGYCGGARYIDVEGVALTAYRDASTSVGEQQYVPSRELVLRLSFTERRYGGTRPRPGGFAALADCKPPTYTEQVDSIRITSRYAYDAQHPVGAPLNDLLKTEDFGGTLINPTLSQLLTSPENAESWEGRRFQLSTPPAASGPQQFRVRLRLTNGETYDAETVVLNVTR